MAVFSYRTEELKPKVIRALFVETQEDRSIISSLKNENPIVLEGSRGTGKSFLLKMAELELFDSFQEARVLPVYVSFKESSLVQANEANKFLYWMMSKICAQLLRSLRNVNLLEPDEGSISLLRGGGEVNQPSKVSLIADQFENSWKDPRAHIDVSSIPDVDDFLGALEDICEDRDIERFCFLFDEAAHVFRLSQQHSFFTLFRDLRSPYSTCNAAVYPGVTSFGPSFEMKHDATLIKLDRDIFSPKYAESMREIVSKQVTKKLSSASDEDKKEAEKISKQMDKEGGNFEILFPVIAGCAFGNPRTLLKSVGSILSFSKNDVDAFIKSFYRSEVWKEHTALGDKYAALKGLVDWGRDFLEQYVLPDTQEKNSNLDIRSTKESTAFFWVHKDSPVEVKRALSLLAYSGLVQEMDKAVRATRSQLGSRYVVHIGALMSLASNPIAELDRIIPHLSIKRMTEYGKDSPAFASLEQVDEMPDDLLSMDIVEAQFSQSVSVLDLTPWQVTTLKNNEYISIKDVFVAGEDKLIEDIHRVGPVRARQISNAARAAVLEYLL